jgi:hypothetical protein
MMSDRIPAETYANISTDSINGRAAERVEFTTSVKGVPAPIHYKIAFVENQHKLYTVMTWTTAARLEQNTAEMENVLRSFRPQI